MVRQQAEIGRKRAEESARERMGEAEDGNRAHVSVFAWFVCRYAMQQCVRELLSQEVCGLKF